MIGSQILLNGISPEQLVELIRPMIQQEVCKMMLEREEKLISATKACEFFASKISKPTLKNWTDNGYLKEHRIGGRVFYLESEIINSCKTLKKYKPYEIK